MNEVVKTFNTAFHIGAKISLTCQLLPQMRVTVCTDCVRRRENYYASTSCVFVLVALLPMPYMLPVSSRSESGFFVYLLGAILAIGGSFSALIFDFRRLVFQGNGVNDELATRAMRSDSAMISSRNVEKVKMFSLSKWVSLEN